MSSLYELTNATLELEEMLMSGDIDEDTYKDTIESLDIENKIENICKVIRNLTAEMEMYKTEKDRLAERQKTAENGIKRLKDSLLHYMLTTEQNKVKQGVFSVRVNRSDSVSITDPLSIPTDYLKFSEPTINKAEIKKALKNGDEIPGAELVKNESIVIR